MATGVWQAHSTSKHCAAARIRCRFVGIRTKWQVINKRQEWHEKRVPSAPAGLEAGQGFRRTEHAPPYQSSTNEFLTIRQRMILAVPG
jgi:hypothetical protein